VRAALLTRARAGDADAFAQLVAPHRRELHVHCYRILGSAQDAEDALQEALFAAWQGLAGYEERASVRTWLYRIATNRCLNMLRAGDRRPRSHEEQRPLLPVATPTDEPLWLEPYPDQLLDELPDQAPGPEPRYEMREAISLAFIIALQLLPARQRAALILHDVLGYRAGEIAAMLESTQESVRSALKRARASLDQRLREEDHGAAPPLPRSPDEQRALERFTTAFERRDFGVLVAMFTEDVRFSMPPLPFEYRGLEALTQVLTPAFNARPRPRRLIPTRANGEPAFGLYLWDDRDGIFHAAGLLVVTLAGERVAKLTRFETGVLPNFGLPRSLPAYPSPR
jgi:RNA polymerase sigma-70 factor (TIGR02960 family)